MKEAYLKWKFVVSLLCECELSFSLCVCLCLSSIISLRIVFISIFFCCATETIYNGFVQQVLPFYLFDCSAFSVWYWIESGQVAMHKIIAWFGLERENERKTKLNFIIKMQPFSNEMVSLAIVECTVESLVDVKSRECHFSLSLSIFPTISDQWCYQHHFHPLKKNQARNK